MLVGGAAVLVVERDGDDGDVGSVREEKQARCGGACGAGTVERGGDDAFGDQSTVGDPWSTTEREKGWAREIEGGGSVGAWIYVREATAARRRGAWLPSVFRNGTTGCLRLLPLSVQRHRGGAIEDNLGKT